MDLVFNELSVEPLAKGKTEAFSRVDLFLATFKKASQLNFNKIRFDVGFESIILAENYTLIDFCNEPQNRTKATLLRGLFKYPFIDENSEEENQYIRSSFSMVKGGDVINPYGLAAAYLYSIPGIGFCSNSFWENCSFRIVVFRNEEHFDEDVVCVSKPEHFEHQNVIEFIQNNIPFKLIETDIDPKDKPISLRDDHGRDILDSFARRLRFSNYVLSIVNSLPFNPAETEFIRKTYSDGRIEIVLTKTDKGLGLVVKTTGRNKRETDEIAKILENKFK